MVVCNKSHMMARIMFYKAKKIVLKKNYIHQDEMFQSWKKQCPSIMYTHVIYHMCNFRVNRENILQYFISINYDQQLMVYYQFKDIFSKKKNIIMFFKEFLLHNLQQGHHSCLHQQALSYQPFGWTFLRISWSKRSKSK